MEIESIKKKVLEDVDPELKRKKAREMRKQRIIVSIQFLGLIAVIILLFYMFMGISTVDGDSMYPTLRDKNVVVYKRMNSEFRQGDIVALKQPDGTEYVKRVIAVAGDTVNIQGGLCKRRKSRGQRCDWGYGTKGWRGHLSADGGR